MDILRVCSKFVLLLSALYCLSVRGAWAARQDPVSTHSSFAPPVPPRILDDDGRAHYMVEHYWDGFDFRDSGWLRDSISLKQIFSRWADWIRMLPADDASNNTGYIVTKAAASGAMLARFAELADLHFADPNSPYRNEEAYIPILERLVQTDKLSPAERIRYEEQLKWARKNRPGTKAAELEGTAADGRKIKLSSLQSDYTLLLFYTPGCPTCGFVERRIENSTIISPLITAGRLQVYAMYTDNDYKTWRQGLSSLPVHGWTTVCDPNQTVNRTESYVIAATPTLYLLDREKRVILKDALLDRIESWLRSHAGGAKTQRTPR